MKTDTNRGKYIGLMFALLLFLTLAVCALFTVLIGAQIYENINDRMEGNYQGQTALTYISNKVRQADTADAVFVKSQDGTDILCMKENLDGQEYITMVYYRDGYISELFTDEYSGLGIGDGMEVIEAGGLDFSKEDDLLKIHLTTTEGKEEDLILSLRSEGGAYEY